MLATMLRAAANNESLSVGIPQSGLVAHWTMDSISGSTLIDETGNYNGVIVGAVQAVGIEKKALSFDGVDGKVDVSMTLSSNFTISFWVNTSLISGDDMCLLGAGAAGSSGITFYASTNYGGADNQMRVYALGSEVIVGPDIRNTGWRHVILSKSGSSWALYVDLDLSGVGTRSGGFSSGFAFGNISYSAKPFSGLIDQFVVYNRELESSEREAVYSYI